MTISWTTVLDFTPRFAITTPEVSYWSGAQADQGVRHRDPHR